MTYTSSIWNNMKQENNLTTTENNAVAYKTTFNALYDFMFKAGTMRNEPEEDIIKLFSEALEENKVYAICLLFYLRDIRQGQGERKFFRICMKYLLQKDQETFFYLLQFVPEYGSWNDIIYFLSLTMELIQSSQNNIVKHRNELKRDVIIGFIHNQLKKDLINLNENCPISLLAKWLPSENTTSKSVVQLAKYLRKQLNYSSKEYRLKLSQLRQYLKITERQMSTNNWENINYNNVTSKAMLKYKNAFLKHDIKRFSEYINNLVNKKPNTKINAATLYPMDIMKQLFDNNKYDISIKDLSEEEYNILDAQWNALPDYFGDNFDNAIAVIDVSGSMCSFACQTNNYLPILTSVGLGLYLAERNKGIFHNKFITFSSKPELIEVKGVDIVSKVQHIISSNWNMSTNIDAVFNLIFNALLKISPEQRKNEIPSRIYIISDMQFDSIISPNEDNKTVFNHWKTKFHQYDLELPTIVFWNASSYGNKNVPITEDESGAILCSGNSPSVVKYLMNGDMSDTSNFIFEIVNNPRYKNIFYCDSDL